VLPYFTWFMLLVTTLALIGEIRETTDDGKQSVTSEYHTYLFWVDLIFVTFTLAELIIKVGLHKGCVHMCGVLCVYVREEWER